jgi:hypothetical protein
MSNLRVLSALLCALALATTACSTPTAPPVTGTLADSAGGVDAVTSTTDTGTAPTDTATTDIATTDMATADMATSGGDATSVDTAGPKDSGAVAKIPWEKMNFDQRVTFMTDVVQPTMAAMFKAFDAKKFGNFDCANCHGKNGKGLKYKMPNGIHPLDATKMPKDKAATFMADKVMPKMVELLELPKFGGMNCFSCHASK